MLGFKVLSENYYGPEESLFFLTISLVYPVILYSAMRNLKQLSELSDSSLKC